MRRSRNVTCKVRLFSKTAPASTQAAASVHSQQSHTGRTLVPSIAVGSISKDEVKSSLERLPVRQCSKNVPVIQPGIGSMRLSQGATLGGVTRHQSCSSSNSEAMHGRPVPTPVYDQPASEGNNALDSKAILRAFKASVGELGSGINLVADSTAATSPPVEVIPWYSNAHCIRSSLRSNALGARHPDLAGELPLKLPDSGARASKAPTLSGEQRVHPCIFEPSTPSPLHQGRRPTPLPSADEWPITAAMALQVGI